MSDRHVLFDFDGVIADSFDTVLEVTRLLCPHLSPEDYRRRFEGNIYEWDNSVEEHTPECRTDVSYLDELGLRLPQVKPFAGMPESLADLAGRYSLAVVSSTEDPLIGTFLEAHGIADHFADIMGKYTHRSKTHKIHQLLTKYGIAPESAVFVTDTLGDMREAARAGVGAIGVTWGFHDPERLSRGAPFRIVGTPAELSAAIADYFAR